MLHCAISLMASSKAFKVIFAAPDLLISLAVCLDVSFSVILQLSQTPVLIIRGHCLVAGVVGF